MDGSSDPMFADTTTAAPKFARVESIDLVRGLVMVLMVLDHVRDYFGHAPTRPEDLAVTTPALFFTRWITHFCAPTFMFLAGVSAALAAKRRTRNEMARHLLIRGFWLILLEQTWGNVTMFFTYPHLVLGMVLWAIGWSMIGLAGLIYLPRAAIATIGLLLIFGHNAFDAVQFQTPWLNIVWTFLHGRGFVMLGPVPVLVGYAFIPWVGVMACGYALGPVFLESRATRVKILLGLGLSAILAFVVLRGFNIYGDPVPWKTQQNQTFTLMSILNCLKYPPSLLYLLMTLGPMLVVLALFDRGIGRVGHVLHVFGRVPLFFYLMQWPVAHGLAVVWASMRGYPIGWLFQFPPFQAPDDYGHNLGVVYCFWVITVALLYYPCIWWYGVRGRFARAR